jgi:tetraacyldisaccharide 4'-kinase
MFRNVRLYIDSSSSRFAEFAVDVIYGRRAGRRAALFGAMLYGPSLLYNGVVQCRLWLYRKRIFHDQPLGCLVVVVGNLTVGGTGKTPVVEKFARSLAERGRKVAILSRGYKRKPEPLWRRLWRQLTHGKPPPPKVVSDGRRVLLDSEEAGDEPFMLARNLPGVVVLVDKNRVKSGSYAIRKYGVDTLLLDDGFQYLPLKGRLNLLLIDKTNPFGNRNLLPRGILREPVKHLKRASYVFLTKSDGRPDPELEQLIRRHNKEAEIIECAHRPQFLQSVWGEERLPLETLKGKRVGAFSAIAVPESFEQFLRDFGASLLYSKRFIDHHRFSEHELKQIFQQAEEAGLDFLVTTEKDAVRLPFERMTELPLYYLRLEIEIISGVDDFEDAVSRICFSRLPSQQAGAVTR